MTWLDKLKTGDYESEYQWLLRFLNAVTPSTAVVRMLLYGAIALLVFLSLGLIVAECYYAGVFVKLPGARRTAVPRKPLPKASPQASASLQHLAERFVNIFTNTP